MSRAQRGIARNLLAGAFERGRFSSGGQFVFQKQRIFHYSNEIKRPLRQRAGIAQ